LILALSYGARAEIVDATRSLMRAAERGELDPEQLDEKAFASHLYLPDVPDPDLMIRTGGEYRVSNFLLWQIAYSELYSAPVMWPDFHRADFEEAILEYAGRERRFGRTGAQARSGSGSPNDDGASTE
jgi:undecaprenyl diphosphate synthase